MVDSRAAVGSSVALEEERDPFVGASQQVAASWIGRWSRLAAACGVACAGACAVGAAIATATPRTVPGSGAANDVVQLRGDAVCQFFWKMKVDNMVAEGWGSRVLYVAAFYQRFRLWAKECQFYIAEDVAEEWESWGLEPPFERISTADWAVAQSDLSIQTVDTSFMVTMRGAWRGEPISGFWSGEKATTIMAYSDWAGCWNSTYDTVLLQIFDKLLQRPPAISGDYIGLHVRHGDKQVEGALMSFQETLEIATAHSSSRSIFLATDDASIIANEISAYKARGFNFTFTDYVRQVGGEAATCDGTYCYHENNAETVKAVFADTLALAHASVLVGSFNSNFFRVAWMLNYLRRSEKQRNEDWCYDVMTKRPCNWRHQFVCEFVVFAQNSEDVPNGLLPDSSSLSLRDCTNPLADGQ